MHEVQVAKDVVDQNFCVQLCELYGPQASQLPTLNIFLPLQGPVYQNNIAERQVADYYTGAAIPIS